MLLKSKEQLHFISYLQVFQAVLISNRATEKPLSFCSRLEEVVTHSSPHQYSAPPQTASGHFCFQLISNAIKITHIYAKRKLFFPQIQKRGTGFVFKSTNAQGKQHKLYIQYKHFKCNCLLHSCQENNFEVSAVCKPHSSQDGNFT